MLLPTFNEEITLWNSGFDHVCGLDEAGCGAWAGPLVAAAVVFKPHQDIPNGINDSKKLSPPVRARLEKEIKQTALAWAVGVTSVKTIATNGISAATQLAMRQAVEQLKIQPDFHLIDYIKIRDFAFHPQKSITRGDQTSLTIAAASILAKTHRDRLMVDLHGKDERYHFHQHKGYGTKLHQECLTAHGSSRYHRLSFVPNTLSTKAYDF